MSVKTTSSNAPRYSLSADQKKQIIALLNLSDDKAPTILEALERLVRVDGWLGFSSTGEVIKDKLAARRVRDFKAVSKSLASLATVLSKIDPQVLQHLDDQFSYLQIETSQTKDDKQTTQRKVLPVVELIRKMRDWAKNSAEKIKEDDASGYLKRFLSELEDFWFWQLNGSIEMSDVRLSGLLMILFHHDKETTRKQVRRWRNSKGADKLQG